MENKIRYTLGKQERLKSRKTIEQLFAGGKSFSLFPFKVIYKKEPAGGQLPTNNNCLQAAFSISKKHFKKAVHRNRVKRLMKESYRLQKTVLQNQVEQNKKNLTIFILYVSNELPDYEMVVLKMDAVLKRLQKITNEETVDNT